MVRGNPDVFDSICMHEGGILFTCEVSTVVGHLYQTLVQAQLALPNLRTERVLSRYAAAACQAPFRLSFVKCTGMVLLCKIAVWPPNQRGSWPETPCIVPRPSSKTSLKVSSMACREMLVCMEKIFQLSFKADNQSLPNKDGP